MKLKLVSLAAEEVAGIYTVASVPGRMPERMRFLHPDAAKAYRTIAPWVVVSDMFRSPESSLQAVREKRGAQPPGYSAHNYGLAIDIDIGASRKRLAKRIGRASISKAELDEALEAAGWFCHRRDHLIAHEAWHQNFLGIGTKIGQQYKSTAGWIEARIQALYGAQMQLSDRDAQAALKRLGMYAGDVDGKVGPLTREATRIFQRAWGINETGRLDSKTQRTLAYVTCEREIVA